MGNFISKLLHKNENKSCLDLILNIISLDFNTQNSILFQFSLQVTTNLYTFNAEAKPSPSLMMIPNLHANVTFRRNLRNEKVSFKNLKLYIARCILKWGRVSSVKRLKISISSLAGGSPRVRMHILFSRTMRGR
jgi:hypothetical protein